MKTFALLVARAIFIFHRLSYRGFITLLAGLLAGLCVAGAAIAVLGLREPAHQDADADAGALANYISANGSTSNYWQIAGATGPYLSNDGGAASLIAEPEDADTPAHDTVIQAQAAYAVPLAGTFNTQLGSPSVTSTVSGVVSGSEVIVFGNQPYIAYTVLSAVGPAITLTTNFGGTNDATNTAILISATVANQSGGNVTFDLGAANGPKVNHVFFQQNGRVFGAIGTGNGPFFTDFWLTNNNGVLVPSGTNYLVASDGVGALINAPTGDIRFNIASSIYMDMTTTGLFLSFATLEFSNSATSPMINEAPQSVTDAGAATGHPFSITAQAGEPAGGVSNNGGVGGNLLLSAGSGGTSVGGDAGNAGQVNLQAGGATVFGVDYSGQYSEKSSGISTASATHTFTASEIANPYLVLNGTTATPTCSSSAEPRGPGCGRRWEARRPAPSTATPATAISPT